MKNKKHLPIKCLSLCIILGLINTLTFAQNVGIGEANPKNKLEIAGNLVVKSETVKAVKTPTAAQTIVLINGASPNLSHLDSIHRIYDPGGSTGNYLANLNATVAFDSPIALVGYEINIEEIQLGTGDSLIIKDYSSRLLAVGNNYSSTGIYTFQSQSLRVEFKSNADASLGTGFSLLIKKLYADPSAAEINPSSLAGNSLSFDVKKGSLMVGTGNKGNIGDLSMVVGRNNDVNGEYSTAIGNNNSSGHSSFTAGLDNRMTGNYNYTLGMHNRYQGSYGYFMGFQNIASGLQNLLLGFSNTSTNSDHSYIFGTNNTTTNSYYATLLGSDLRGAGTFFTALGVGNKLPATIFTPGGWDGRDQLLAVGNGYSDYSNALVILKNGNTGIGIDAPAAKLHIKDKIIIEQPLATGIAGLEWRSNNSYRGGLGYDATEDRFFFYEGKSNSNIFYLNNGLFGIRREATTNALEVNGNASKSTAGSWLGNSDERLKKDIKPIDGALQKIMQLKGITYEWADNKTGIKRPEGIQMGFTAQNIQAVFPGEVSTDAQGYLQTAYGTYDALIVEAIKELKNENDLLKKEIAEIKRLLEKK